MADGGIGGKEGASLPNASALALEAQNATTARMRAAVIDIGGMRLYAQPQANWRNNQFSSLFIEGLVTIGLGEELLLLHLRQVGLFVLKLLVVCWGAGWKS